MTFVLCSLTPDLLIGNKLHGWTGAPCQSCNGTGENTQRRMCSACKGTTAEYGPLPFQIYEVSYYENDHPFTIAIPATSQDTARNIVLRLPKPPTLRIEIFDVTPADLTTYTSRRHAMALLSELLRGLISHQQAHEQTSLIQNINRSISLIGNKLPP